MKKILLALAALPFVFCTLQSKKINVYSIGDSTMADTDTAKNYPGRGWMQVMQPFFAGDVAVYNYGRSGRSSKSFRDEGHWQKVLDKLKAGDYVFIQFGHNDEKTDSARHTDARTGFRDNMKRYVEEVRRKNAYPILFTSIVRRSFDAGGHLKDTHGDYVTVVRRLATELGVPLVDLNASMGRLVDSLGPEASKKLYMYVEPGVTTMLPQGRKDDTHLCQNGARQVAALAARGIGELKLPLSAEIINSNIK